MNKTCFRIEIIGGIAAGKTTLSQLLEPMGLFVINEDFAANPFLKMFYLDPNGFSFETEITFLMQHYHAIKIVQKNYRKIVCDYSLLLDLAYSDVTLNKRAEKAIFSKLYKEIINQLSIPDILVYLKCPPEVLLNRIQKRGRANERSITIEYLTMINKSIDKRIKKNNRNKLIAIDSNELNFADNVYDQKIVKDIIYGQIL